MLCVNRTCLCMSWSTCLMNTSLILTLPMMSQDGLLLILRYSHQYLGVDHAHILYSLCTHASTYTHTRNSTCAQHTHKLMFSNACLTVSGPQHVPLPTVHIYTVTPHTVQQVTLVALAKILWRSAMCHYALQLMAGTLTGNKLQQEIVGLPNSQCFVPPKFSVLYNYTCTITL